MPQAVVTPGACPPLPTITGNMVTGVQMQAARDHFRCLAMDSEGRISPSAYDRAMINATNWIGQQQARFLSEEVKAAPAYQRPGEINVVQTQVGQVVRGPTPVEDPRAILPEPTATNQMGGGPMPARAMTDTPPATQTSHGWVDAVIGGVGGFITGGIPGAIGGAAAGFSGGGGGGGTSTPCPPGYRREGSNCVEEGVRGTVERVIPGGQTGTMADAYGEAVVGSFGKPALVPAQVGTINGGPIFRCPPGAVLGKDNLCYAKGSIPNSLRKWPKPTRPLLTAQDMKTLRRIDSIQNRVQKAAMSAGFKKPAKR